MMMMISMIMINIFPYTPSSMIFVINQTFVNSLRRIIAEKSELMRDWPRKPSEEVVYWIEYVVRHRGAKHLRSPLIDLPW